MNLLLLDAWDKKTGALNVIIETSKGSRSKLKYNPDEDLMELGKVLPRGMVFPFDFGFIPSTVGDDGDPLDVLVLLDEPVPAGCKIAARLIGVMEIEQTEDGKTERNDRLIAVAEECHEHCHILSLKDINERLIEEVEHFFSATCDMSGKKFKLLDHRGPKRAQTLAKQGLLDLNSNSGEAKKDTNELAPHISARRPVVMGAKAEAHLVVRFWPQ